MIPIELRLTNFMSYKYMDEPLSFTSIHTAVLCGPNGHGKSSLLDAITWALWGRARGVDKRGTGTDDLIHHKAAHMQVEFAFELEGQRYRVIRSRQRKGKTGTSRLEFQIIDCETLRSLTGETMNATQDAINRVLRMDYDTFVNSAFIMQGRADNFMTKTANERKEILAEILGLSVYDELEELAKEKRRALSDTLREIDNRTAHIDQELEHLPRYEAEVKEATGELAAAQAESTQAEALLTGLREKKAVFDLKQAQLTELHARVGQAKRDVAETESQLAALQETAGSARALVARQDEIDLRHHELTELRKTEEALSGSAQRYGRLEAVARKVELAVEQARGDIESQLKHLTQRQTDLLLELGKKTALEAASAANRAELSRLEHHERELEERRVTYQERHQQKATLDAQIQALELRLADAEKRRGLLTDGDSCPLCKKPLAADERHTLSADFDREAAALANDVAARRSQSAALARELDALALTGKKLAESVKGKSELQVKEGMLAEKLQGIEKAGVEARALSVQTSELSLKLAQGAFAQEEQSSLGRLKSEMDVLGYSPEVHQQVKDRLKELLRYESLKANLENARSNLQLTETSIMALASQKDTKLKALADEEGRVTALANELASFRDLGNEISRAEAALSDKKRFESALIDRRSAAAVKIDSCTAFAVAKGELAKERKRAAKDAEIFDTLAFVFSKKGIQALIIENTIPEIEEEANALLHRLTSGQMNLRFITQKDQKTGGVIETLDLVITDGELGERKYELFSGGEAFRINFAVRIALSKLLSRRAGARLETLVVDEGFGTQDEEGKERLIEAISAIQNDFKKILVVTHLEDLKELFPARIEVVKKRGEGSIVSMA